MSDPWNERYRNVEIGMAKPARVLSENTHLLPAGGRALDLACGRGGNALLLAHCGLETFAWDRSAVVIEKLKRYAAPERLSLTAEMRDVVREPPEPHRFDVIAVGYFLERSLAPALIAALRQGGLLFYQTFTREAVDDAGPRNPAYRLAPGELREMFAALRLLVYREEGLAGDRARGFRNEALLIGMRAP